MSCYLREGSMLVKAKNIYAPTSDQTLNQQKLCQIGARLAPSRSRNSVSKQWRGRSKAYLLSRSESATCFEYRVAPSPPTIICFVSFKISVGEDISSSWTLVGRPRTHLVPMMSPSFSRQRMSKEASIGFCILQMYENISVIIRS